MRDKIGIYIHIPFCKAKCNYCGFLSSPCEKDEDIDRYVDYLLKEIQLYKDNKDDLISDGDNNKKVETIFIGGGTPSLLTGEQVASIINNVKDAFEVDDDAEITMESNPESATYEKLVAYKEAGVNRISFGFQSTCAKILTFLGRIHDEDTALKAYMNARKAGFDNINIDLMFGIPDQTMEEWAESIGKVITLEPEHISAYSLQIEDGTEFGRRYKEGELQVLNYADDRDMFHAACNALWDSHYKHYEISNFAKPGYECRHNLKYWNLEEFIGLGLGASSYYNGFRYKNTNRMDLYENAIEKDQLPVENRHSVEKETKEAAMSVYCITALRTTKGIEYKEFEELFGEKFREYYKDKMLVMYQHAENGYVDIDQYGIRLSGRGVDLSNFILQEFV